MYSSEVFMQAPDSGQDEVLGKLLNPKFVLGFLAGVSIGAGTSWAVIDRVYDKSDAAAQKAHEAQLEAEVRRADDAKHEYERKCELATADRHELDLCRDKAQMIDATVCGTKLAALQAEHATARRNLISFQEALAAKTDELERIRSLASNECVQLGHASDQGEQDEPRNAGTGPVNRIEWNTSAEQWCRNIGQTFQFSCPAGGAISPVFGSSQYSCKSSICTAAVHAGLISAADGGLVVARMIGSNGKKEGGVFRNGVGSRPNHALWYTEPSFTFD
jgi:hypothetical protein